MKVKNYTKKPLTSISVSAYSATESRNFGREAIDEVELLKEQVALLQSNLNDKELASRIASAKLVKLIPDLESITSESTATQSKKIIDELKEIAASLSNAIAPQHFVRSVSIRPENYQMKHLDAPNNATIKFRQRSHSSSNNKPSIRHSPRSLVNDKELKELHFNIKRNF